MWNVEELMLFLGALMDNVKIGADKIDCLTQQEGLNSLLNIYI